jgi:hypothetical protein
MRGAGAGKVAIITGAGRALAESSFVDAASAWLNPLVAELRSGCEGLR